jgi:anti-sigma factor (TIGR02949 family)
MILDMIKRWFGGGGSQEPRDSEGPTGGTTDTEGAPEMLTCHEALEWLYEFLDGELPDADSRKVDQHFKMCQACYPHLKLEENFRSRLQTAVGEGDCPDDVRARVLDLLAREEARGG